MREKIEKVCSSNQSAAPELTNFNQQITGRPRKEVNQPGLLSTIVRIIEASSAADDRRHYEHFRSVETLYDFQSELVIFGFNLSRSATYLRLLPQRSDSREEKCHLHTVNMKLVRPENSLRKKTQIECLPDDLWMIYLMFASYLVSNRYWFFQLKIRLE